MNPQALYNLEAEMSILGCFLTDRRTLKHASEIMVDDFTDKNHQSIFKAISEMVFEKRAVDIITVDSALTAQGTNITPQIIACAQFPPTTSNVLQYIDIVRQLSTRRRVIDISEFVLKSARQGDMPANEIIDFARQSLREVVRSRHAWLAMDTVLMSTYDLLERRAKGEFQAITSGIADLDRLIGGFFDSELTILGARPSVGKTAAALNIGLHAARKGKKTGFVSIEMADIQLGQRLISNSSNTNGMKIRRADLAADDWKIITQGINDIYNLPMSFLCSANTIEDIDVEVQKRVDVGELDFLIIDYLQLMRTRQKFESERLRVSYISGKLKQMCKDYKIPILALAQVNRTVGNGPPRMSDLKESGNIEQDADGIIMMHRPDDSRAAGVDPRDRDRFDEYLRMGFEYIVFSAEKQRQGETGAVANLFHPSTMHYTSIDRRN